MTVPSTRLTEYTAAPQCRLSITRLVAIALLAVLAISCAAAPTAAPTPTPSPEPTATAAPVELSVVGRWSAPPRTTVEAIAAADIGSIPHLAVAIESAASSGVALVDVSDPASPTMAGAIETPFDSRELVAERISVSGGTAYVSLVGPGGGLWVVDVSNPPQPRHISMLPFELSLLWGVHAEGDTVVMAGLMRSESGLPSERTLGSPGIVTVDISDPARPAVAASMAGSLHGSYEAAVEMQSGIAYVVGLDRLHVMDVSDPSAIMELATLARAEDAPIEYTITDAASGITGVGYERAESAPRDVAVQGGYAYVASGSGGLRVIAVSTPAAPVEVGAAAASSLQSVAVSGDWVFAYDYAVPPQSDRPGVLLAIDVSRPESPTVEAALELKALQVSGEVAAHGGRVYAIDGFRDVVAVELSGG
ncbi:MAG: hypothetical protein OYI31_06130 [Chloroflexota bacterium]|nr:hypothetical protein [Chloroflexota bacterium]MDE2942157.1 hypothetical protein [Chloroflexota bacterium]MDE3268011.1 hypothetical protein [Chloroflexota bacterium]